MSDDFSQMQLGKQEYSYSEKTAKLARFMTDLEFPAKYDLDKGRAAFPFSPLGNDLWGCCVKAAQANGIMRLERIETRSTAAIQSADVVREYQAECQREFGAAPVSPGDPHDTGLYIRQNITNWRKVGFHFKGHTFTIDAFGELDPHELDQLRAACFHLHGLYFGLQLPEAMKTTTQHNVWDYQGQTGDEWKPGSWGGHGVYCKAYMPGSFEVITWGAKVHMSDAFVLKYCDEVWAVVDSLDSWRTKQSIDVAALKKYLLEIGASNMEGQDG